MSTLNFKKPERQKESYVSRVNTVGSARSVRVTIPFARYVGCTGHTLRLWLPPDASVKGVMDGYDAASLEATVENNGTWFANALTDEDIHTFFRKSYQTDHMTLLMSGVKRQMIHYNNVVVDTLTDIHDLASCRISAEIEIQGLYFFSTRFGLRWIVRALYIASPEKEAEAEAEEAIIDRGAIEQAWVQDLERLNVSVDADIQDYMEKINRLVAFKEDLQATFKKARGSGECSAEWNEALSEVATKSAKYYNGSLFYL